MSNQEQSRHHGEREHRNKHVATWVAAAGTLAVIMALWAILLPTQLGGNGSFGIRNAANWLSGRAGTVKIAEPETTFQEAMLRTQAVLEKIEASENAKTFQAQRAQALQLQADILRTKIEAAAQEQEKNPAEPKKK